MPLVPVPPELDSVTATLRAAGGLSLLSDGEAISVR